MDSPDPDNDRQLLDRYAAQRDERAFRTLVERHLPLVHGTARRITGSDDLAQDVAQSTFIRLAQRAALIPRDVTLPAWLHRVCHHLAIDLVRSEASRKNREHRTAELHAVMDPPAAEPSWPAMAPVIDDLINGLPAADREVLLLRYYRNESHVRIGARLGLSEEAARKRSVRALEKLRALLGKKGIATSSAALATLLPAHAATPVPATLLLAVSHAAQGVVPLAPHGLSLHLAMTTLQKSAITGTAFIFLASFGYAVRSSHPNATAAVSSSSSPAPESRELTFRPHPERRQPLSAEDRLARLRVIVAIPSPVTRTRELLAFTDLLPPSQFPETVTQLHELLGPRPELTPVMTMVMDAWARLEPRACVEWASNKKGYNDELKIWGESDPDAALAWVRDHTPRSDDSQAAALESGLASVLTGLATRDPAAAMKLIQEFQDPEVRGKILVAIADMTNGQLPQSVERLLTASEGDPARSALLVWGIDPLVHSGRAEYALEQLLADPEAMQKCPVQYFFQNWQRQEASDAMTHFDLVPQGKLRDEAVAGCALEWSLQNHLPDALALLQQYPGAATDLVVARMVESSRTDQLPIAMEQILRMQDPALRDEVLKTRLSGWLEQDPGAARQWIDTHAVPASIKEALPAASPATPAKP